MIRKTLLDEVGRLHDRLERTRGDLGNLETSLPAGVFPKAQIQGYLSTIDSLQQDVVSVRDRGGSASIPELIRRTQAQLYNYQRTLGTLRPLVQECRDVQQVQEVAKKLEKDIGDLEKDIDGYLEEIDEFTVAEEQAASMRSIRDLTGGIGRSIDTVTTYPVLTQGTAYTGAAPYPAGGLAGAAPLGQVIENTLRNVLAWRPRIADHQGFSAALIQSFPCQEIEERRQCVYTPRTYAAQVHADMGAVTGAQASIYARAQNALEQSVILLDRIVPLSTTADEEEVDAVRAILRSELTELVHELGLEGGPRAGRVNALFGLLLGPNQGPTDPENIRGQLGMLREKGGLKRKYVNTIEEEQNLTDFVTLVDYVNSLKQSWDDQQAHFDRRGDAQKYLGTQLVLVSRDLAVIAESVHEVGATMDSVFLGPAERQTIELTFRDRSPMSVAELLAWVDRVASEEGPRLIQDGGKIGVRALEPILEELHGLVSQATIPPQDRCQLPPGYATPRVRRALVELAKYLEKASDRINQLLKG